MLHIGPRSHSQKDFWFLLGVQGVPRFDDVHDEVLKVGWILFSFGSGHVAFSRLEIDVLSFFLTDDIAIKHFNSRGEV